MVCRIDLVKAGKQAPRTCAECGLGPCVVRFAPVPVDMSKMGTWPGHPGTGPQPDIYRASVRVSITCTERAAGAWEWLVSCAPDAFMRSGTALTKLDALTHAAEAVRTLAERDG